MKTIRKIARLFKSRKLFYVEYSILNKNVSRFPFHPVKVTKYASYILRSRTELYPKLHEQLSEFPFGVTLEIKSVREMPIG